MSRVPVKKRGFKSTPRPLGRRPSRLLPEDIWISDRCWDSHGNRLCRARAGEQSLARLLSAGYVAGVLEISSILIEFVDMVNSNVWLPANNRAVRAMFDELIELLHRLSGCEALLSILGSLEGRSGRGRTLHIHGLTPTWVADLIREHLGENITLTLPSGCQVRIGKIRPVIGKELRDLWTYMSKCADADALFTQERTRAQWQAGVRRSTARSQEAEAARKAEGLYRLPSCRICIELPPLPTLTDRQRQGLRSVLRGTAPVLPARTFVSYLDAVADRLPKRSRNQPRQRNARETAARAAQRPYYATRPGMLAMWRLHLTHTLLLLVLLVAAQRRPATSAGRRADRTLHTLTTPARGSVCRVRPCRRGARAREPP